MAKKRNFKSGDFCYVYINDKIDKGVIGTQSEVEFCFENSQDWTLDKYYVISFDGMLLPIRKERVFRSKLGVQNYILKKEYDKVKKATDVYNRLAKQFKAGELLRIVMEDEVITEEIK